MAYIYKITNDLNNKIYIGKTEFSVEKRFKEHCQDALKKQNAKRPLYNAMRKYGIEHFKFETIEKTTNPEEREKYWINFYNSYYQGYNATLGGDGKAYLDYNLIIKLWNNNKTCKEIAQITKYDVGQISKILKQNGISSMDIAKRANLSYSKSVLQIDKNSHIVLNKFDSCRKAAAAMIADKYTKCKLSTASTHISEVCRNKRKTFAGFIWKYSD